MILPGTIKFFNDHYICGDSYRCVWAVREYPPSTEAQAILSQLADRSNITLRVYNRLVDSMEQRKIIQNATRRNKLMSGGTDVQETLEAENNLKDVIELLGDTQDVGSGLLILCYRVDGAYTLNIPFATLNAQLGVTGEQLLQAKQPIEN